MYITALGPTIGDTPASWAMLTFGHALRGVQWRWIGLEGINGTYEKWLAWGKAGSLKREMRGDTWGSDSLAWELLNNSLCLL